MTDPGAVYLERLKTDFIFFCHELWREMGWDAVAPLSFVEEDMLKWACSGPPRRGLLASRGVGKSHMVAIALAAYRALRNPERKIFIPGKASSEARMNLGLLRGILSKVWFLRHLAPRKGSSDDTKNYFDFAGVMPHKQPSVRAIGMEGATEGNRGHSIFPDDVETDMNTRTQQSRHDLAARVGEFESALYPDLPAAKRGPYYDPVEIVYVGTYHHEDSLYLREASAGVEFRTYPLLYPAPDEKLLNLAPILQDRLDKGLNKPGDLVFPKRFDTAYVEEKRKKGRRYFLMQHMLVRDLADSNTYPLRLEDLMVMDVDPKQAPVHLVWGRQDALGSTAIEAPSLGFKDDCLHRPAVLAPEWAKYTGCIAYIDPSGRGEDETGYAALAHLAGFLHAKTVTGFQGGYSPDALATLALQCRIDRVDTIYIEFMWGGGMFGELFQPVLQRHFLKPGDNPDFPDGWAASIIDDKKVTHGKTVHKEDRIISCVEPITSGHRLVIDRRSAIDPTFQEQFTRITMEPGCIEHYDRIDALAGTIKAWESVLSLDPDTAATRAREGLELDKYNEFRKKYGMRPRAPARWFQHR